MFTFLLDANNYESRKVARDEFNNATVIFSTCFVSDGLKPYETAMLNSEYHDKFFVLENYATKEEALAGHTRWIEKYAANTLPETIEECVNSEQTVLMQELGMELPKYTRKKN